MLSVNIVLPLLLMMAAGYGARAAGLLCETTVTQVNNLCFRVFLPILLMNNIRSASLAGVSGASVLLFSAVGLVLLFAVLMAVVPRLVRENSRRGVVVQALFRSNYALFGMAVLASMFPGEELTLPSLMIPVSVPIYNILAVICLESFRGGQVSPAKLAGKIVRNPLIIGCAAGIVLMLLGNPVPAFLNTALVDLGKIATPLALFTLGASFRLDALRSNGRTIAWVTAGKLVIVPLAVLSIAIALGYREQALASVLIAFGGPVAVSSFTMAQQMDGDSDLAAELVISTTLFSVLTLFVFIFIFKMLGLV